MYSRTCYEKRKDRKPSLTGRIPGCRARGRQREKYMDGIIRTVGDGSKAVREMWESMVTNVCRDTALR